VIGGWNKSQPCTAVLATHSSATPRKKWNGFNGWISHWIMMMIMVIPKIPS
jgi:hypothetical protein